nr:hypothetical protein [Chamaesiphon sp. VAR_48_metabat_135_sub]
MRWAVEPRQVRVVAADRCGVEFLVRMMSALALATPAAIVPIPISATSLAETAALGLISSFGAHIYTEFSIMERGSDTGSIRSAPAAIYLPSPWRYSNRRTS